MKIEASMPSNIALIKYMGKVNESSNVPTNASLSYTLDHLRTFVTIEPAPGAEDQWRPIENLPELNLSENGKKKFLNHFSRLKSHWGIAGHFVVRSGNNFPADCGLASSASSFAALTAATAILAKKTGVGGHENAEQLSALSRQGSGSSCRSFFTPWALWRGEGAEALPELRMHLAHAVILTDAARKTVSSSEAHKRVASSLLFRGRPERAEQRLRELTAALRTGGWRAAFEICWNETWDMHALFETSQPAFGYMAPQSLEVLQAMRAVWNETGDGPLVTMDAGANVHLLLRPEQTAAADVWIAKWRALRSWS